MIGAAVRRQGGVRLVGSCRSGGVLYKPERNQVKCGASGKKRVQRAANRLRGLYCVEKSCAGTGTARMCAASEVATVIHARRKFQRGEM